MRKKVNLAGLIAIFSAITYLSLAQLSTTGSTNSIGILALLFHLGAYFGLAAALSLYFHESKDRYLESVVIAILFGVIMEIGQTQVPGRAFSYIDIGLNSLGASAVLLDIKLGLVSELASLEERVIKLAFSN